MTPRDVLTDLPKGPTQRVRLRRGLAVLARWLRPTAPKPVWAGVLHARRGAMAVSERPLPMP